MIYDFSVNGYLLLRFKDGGNLKVSEPQLIKTHGFLSFRLFAGFFLFYVYVFAFFHPRTVTLAAFKQS